MHTYNCNKSGCNYYSFTKHRLDIHRLVTNKNSETSSPVAQLWRRMLQKESDGWQCAHSSKRSKLDRLTSNFAAHSMQKRPVNSEPVTKRSGNDSDMNSDRFTATELEAEKNRRLTNFTIPDASKARDANWAGCDALIDTFSYENVFDN